MPGEGAADWRDAAQRNVNEDVSIPCVHADGRRSVYGLSWGPLSSNIDGMDAVKAAHGSGLISVMQG